MGENGASLGALDNPALSDDVSNFTGGLTGGVSNPVFATKKDRLSFFMLFIMNLQSAKYLISL